MSAKIFITVILMSLITPTLSISCYQSNEDNTSHRKIHGQHFCSAFFNFEYGMASFGGNERPISQLEGTEWNIMKREDCQLQVHDTRAVNEPHTAMWLCYCFTDYCNSVMTIDEFKSNGFTLEKQLFI